MAETKIPLIPRPDLDQEPDNETNSSSNPSLISELSLKSPVEESVKLAVGVKVVIAISLLLRAGGGAVGLIMGFYLANLSKTHFDHPDAINAALAAIIITSFHLTESLFAPYMGIMSDRWGTRLLIAFGPITALIALQIHPISSLPFTFGLLPLVVGLLLIGRVLEGIGLAATTPATLAYLAAATSHNNKTRARVMGYYEITSLVGIILGSALGGNLWDFFGVNSFRVLGLIYIVALVLLFTFTKGDHLMDKSDKVNVTFKAHLIAYKEILHSGRLWRFLPAWISVNALLGVWFVHTARLMSGDGGLSTQFPDQFLLHQAPHHRGALVGYIFVGFGLAFLVGIFLWTLVFTRLRKTSIMLISCTGMIAAALSVLAINHRLGGVFSLWIFLPILGVSILIESGFTPAALYYLAGISEDHPVHRGKIMGLYSVFLGIGQFIGGEFAALFIPFFAFDGLSIATLCLVAVAVITVFTLRRIDTHD